MIDIDKLEALAKAAMRCQWGDAMEWSAACGDRMEGEYIAAANPGTILELCAEVRRLGELVANIPKSPETMISFIGPHFNSMQAQEWTDELRPAGDLSTVSYCLTVHDLLSAFSWAGLSPENIDSAKDKP